MHSLLLVILLAAEPATSLAPERFCCAALHRVEMLDALLPRVTSFECDYILPDASDPADQRVSVPGLRVIGNGPWGPPRVTMCLLMDNGSGPELITTREEFFRRFAPVETPEEARAFVYLLTGLSLKDAEGALLPIMETKAGYVIRNVELPSAGCVVMPPQFTTLTVLRDGEIRSE